MYCCVSSVVVGAEKKKPKKHRGTTELIRQNLSMGFEIRVFITRDSLFNS